MDAGRKIAIRCSVLRLDHILLLGRAAGRRRVSAILAVDNLEGGLDALAAAPNVRITRLTDHLIIVTDGG